MSSSSKHDAIIRLQRDRFVGLAFAGGDLLIETDLDGRIGYVAGAAQAISGHQDKALIGRRLTDLIVPDAAGQGRAWTICAMPAGPCPAASGSKASAGAG